MASAHFSEFWNQNYQLYQQYYNRNSTDNRTNHEDYYRPTTNQSQQYTENYNQDQSYYPHRPFIKTEEVPPSCQNLNFYQTPNYVENSMTPPPSNGAIKSNETDPNLKYSFERQFPYSESNQREIESFLESPPKTPSSTKNDARSSDSPKDCDSPALRALLTRKDAKNSVNYYQKGKDSFSNFYEKSNYYNPSFCSPGYEASECKDVGSPMVMGEAAETEQSAASLNGSMAGTVNYSQNSEGKMAMAESSDIFPWMKTNKGIPDHTFSKHKKSYYCYY